MKVGDTALKGVAAPPSPREEGGHHSEEEEIDDDEDNALQVRMILSCLISWTRKGCVTNRCTGCSK